GVTDVVICPIGFVSDHVEVIWDLDTELVDEVADLGVRVTRCATPGPSDEFTRMVLDLVDELETGIAGERPGREPSLGCTRDGNPTRSVLHADEPAEYGPTSSVVGTHLRLRQGRRDHRVHAVDAVQQLEHPGGQARGEPGDAVIQAVTGRPARAGPGGRPLD